MTFLRALLVAAALSTCATAAYAAASNTPTLYQPDPALKTASLSELRARVSQACSVIQARLQNASEASFSRKCDCYAGRTMRALSADEVQAYRDTGVFNDSAREKALKAIDSCKLERPTL
jgi:curli biogenesis system outer membrane secretion channel CsgG